jgi:hypothetical protein
MCSVLERVCGGNGGGREWTLTLMPVLRFCVRRRCRVESVYTKVSVHPTILGVMLTVARVHYFCLFVVDAVDDD